jgi:hypothetical protein
MPHAQAPTGAMTLVLRTQVAPAALARDVKRIVHELNPEMPVAGIETLDAVIDNSLNPRRFTLVLFGCRRRARARRDRRRRRDLPGYS